MTPEQLHQIDQARRYAEQDEYVVTRTHIRNLLAIIEQQQAEAVANSATVCNVFGALGDHCDDSLSPAENVRRMIQQQQAASVPFAWAREWDGDVSDLDKYVVVFNEDEKDGEPGWFALYTKPQQAVSVPDGWKLVPVELTPKMRWQMSGEIPMHGGRLDEAYAAALAAAPEAPKS